VKVSAFSLRGTGKELAAEYFHKHSSCSEQTFQIVDSTVLTDALFESEMFGHVNGAYTGSIGEKQGLFEFAAGGAIYRKLKCLGIS